MKRKGMQRQLWGRMRRLIAMAAALTVSWSLIAQSVPSRPLSIPVYHPLVLNPAYVGSKDFTSISLTSRIYNIPDNQIITLHKRLIDPTGGFSRLGVGGFIFQEQKERSWNLGVAGTGAYHLPIDQAKLHNIAFGATLKAILNIPKNGSEPSGNSVQTAFRPNMDLGLYYYGPTAFAGLSVTTLFGTRLKEDLTTSSDSYIPREYHFYGGYKFLLSRKNAIVLEPSLLLSLNDSTFSEAFDHLVPYLKLYLQNFYIGTYIKNLDTFALFFQYQFPRFYTGVFLEFPRVGFLNNDNIIFEISLGVNLGKKDQRFGLIRHW
ncbi:MAG: type IX secretion system membrane protein PorP/SprF [Bacteroidales bacterium]